MTSRQGDGQDLCGGHFHNDVIVLPGVELSIPSPFLQGKVCLGRQRPEKTRTGLTRP